MMDRAVVFDLDDTLYRVRRFTLSGYAFTSAIIAEQGDWTAEAVFRRLQWLYRRGRAGRAYQDLCSDMGTSPDQGEHWLEMHRAHTPRLRLPRLSTDVLGEMRGTWRLGILTNGVPQIQRAKMAALGLEGRVDEVVYADEHEVGGKPAPAVFELMLQRLGVEGSRAVMVGDDPATDVVGGRAVGMRTIRIIRPRHAGANGPEADAVVASLAEVPAIAERLLRSTCG